MSRWLLALLFAFGSVTFLTACPEEGGDTDDTDTEETENGEGENGEGENGEGENGEGEGSGTE